MIWILGTHLALNVLLKSHSLYSKLSENYIITYMILQYVKSYRERREKRNKNLFIKFQITENNQEKR